MKNKLLFISIIILLGFFSSSFTIEKDLSVTDKKIELRNLNGHLNKVNIADNKYQKFKDDPCDNIILKNGEEISGKILEIGITEIKYKKCENINGPTYTIKKSDVLMIRYSNGTKEIFTTESSKEVFNTESSITNNTRASTEVLGILGFILSLIGLLIFGIPLGILAIVFGAISLTKIKKNPKRFKGKGFAIAGIIIGVIDVVALLILLALL